MEHWAIQGDSEDDPEVAALGGESKKKYLGAPKSGHGGEFQLPLLWFDDSPWMSSQLACDHLDSEKGMRFTPLRVVPSYDVGLQHGPGSALDRRSPSCDNFT